MSIGLYWLYSFILGKTLGAETAFAVAFIPTVLMLLSITNLSGIWTNLVDSSALKRSDGLPGFQEGKRVAACGRIYPVSNQPVKSPFTRKDCVAYSYKVEYRGGEFNDTDYAGRRLIPSAVKTPNGDVRLLSWPGFRGFDSSVGIVTDSAKGIMPVLIRGNRTEIEHFLRSQTTKRLMWGVGLAGIANLGIWLAVELTM